MRRYSGVPVAVSPERLGFIIGKGGQGITALEETFNVKIEVDSKTSTVYVSPGENATPFEVMRAKQAIEALSLGFRLEDVLSLSEDEWCLEIVDLNELARNLDDLRRIKARIIGEEGKARKNLEQMSGVKIVVGDKMVGLLGECGNVNVARKAVLMLARGRTHGSVYGYLRAAGRELKRKKLQLWKGDHE
ncbi:MAG: KH domain-containing protein [Thermofilaceae archaeon]|nr:KH domain-containing protein [Thermofilaceae archaeon]MCX8180712.1 KH domain-containing protein [Thermofilaceae archaeon]MDW8003816.1 KH domain-containing protein [Thermofilaceae archaeon]